MTIPQGVTIISDNLFSGCKSLAEVTIPKGVTSISNYAFSGCDSLTSIAIPNTVLWMGVGTFRSCDRLTDVVLPIHLSAIVSEMFYDCVSLKTVSVPDHVDSIGWEVFKNCNALENVYFGGTEEQWSQIEIYDYGNEPLQNATVIFNCAPVDPHNVVWKEATPATCREYWHSAGEYCEDCHAWITGFYDALGGYGPHNTDGERVVVKEPTEDEPGEVIITCTVCGEQGLYAIEKLPRDNSFGGRLRRAAQSIINFFLRLIRWLGGKK